MTTTNGREMTLAAAAGAPDRLGQATAVEQSRAIAEVQGAIVVAQQCPRDVQGAIASMRDSCKQSGLADRAFFKFPRGGTSVQGATVYLARELARCWGNIQYGVSELRRDDVHGQSEMQAYAWDVQTNSRVVTTFVVPHMRDKKDGPERLIDMRDIYENNANAGARRVRECIFSILPPWFVEEAKANCMSTLRNGGGVPLPQRIANITSHFAQDGVTVDQLEKKIGRPTGKWTDVDYAQLTITLTSLRNGETTRELEFPPDDTAIKTKDIVGGEPVKPIEAEPVNPGPAAPPAPQPVEQEDPTGESVSPQGDADAGTVDETASGDAPEPTSGAAPASTPPPGGKGPKARRAQITALVTMLKDNDVPDNTHARLAVVSLLLNERVPALSDLTDQEVTYLYSRIPELVSGGDFAGTIKRALDAAKESVQGKGSDFTDAAGG